MARHDSLFAEGDLREMLGSLTAKIADEVGGIPQDQFLASDEEEVTEHIVSKLSVEPLQIYEDRTQMETEETRIDISGFPTREIQDIGGPAYTPGTEVQVTIPFTGAPRLWKLRPSSFTISHPYGAVVTGRGDQPGTLVLIIRRTHDTPPEEIKRELEGLLRDIRSYIEWQIPDIELFNQNLSKNVERAITSRCQRLKKQAALPELLGIPLKQREGTPPIEPIKLKQNIVRPLSPPPNSGLKSEPGIEERHYENILEIIRHQGRTFETTPATYEVHGEEDLRDMMLASLNIYLKGEGGGEVFRKSGKTDICIKECDRAAFIGECTLWHGEKELLEKIDQLLGYLTWRDAKAAIIIFNKNVKGFTALLSKLPEAVARHPYIVKDRGEQEKGEWRYVFRSAEDEGRRITVHMFLFDLFVEK